MNHASTQSGNVIFYILIAVALLGALSFAVAQNGRSGNADQVQDDKARLYASEIIEYADLLKKATLQLRLRGTSLSSLSFAHDDAHADYGVYGTSPDDEIFNPDGGAVIYQAPDDNALSVSGNLYEFYGSNTIEEVGSTCTAASCADLIAVISGLKEKVCIKINDALGITNPSNAPPVDTSLDTTRYSGSFSYAATIGDEAASSALSGQVSGCFYDNTAGVYRYYQVLISR